MKHSLLHMKKFQTTQVEMFPTNFRIFQGWCYLNFMLTADKWCVNK